MSTPSAQIVCLGMNHRTTPVDLREQLNRSLLDLDSLLLAFRREIGLAENGRFPGIYELVILSTCNRNELYAHVNAAHPNSRQLLTEYLSELHGVDTAVLTPYLQYLTGQQAVDHLMHVAAGLDSQILGEPQILGQINTAYTTAAQTRAAGPVLRRVFTAAIRAGKRAHTETAISSNPASIGSVAIALAQSITGALTDKTAVIIGAGKMAELALKALQKRKIGAVIVVNRTQYRAEELTKKWDGTAYSMAHLDDLLSTANIVISATGSQEYLLTAPQIKQVMATRNGCSLTLIDIAVPRNIDPQVALIPGVHLFDIDNLQSNLDEALATRQQEVPHVKAIIAKEQAVLMEHLRELDAQPFIIDLRKKAEQIRQKELAYTLRHLGQVDPQVAEHLQHLSRSLVNKLLHEPTIHVKEQAGRGRCAEYVATARHLFGLDETEEKS